MPPEGKTPRHKADFPPGNVKLYYQSKKPFISKSFPSRALDPKGSLLYFCRSHFLWPQKGAGRQLSVFPSACSELEVPALCPSTTPLLPGHCWGRDSPSLQCQEGSRSQGQDLGDSPAPQRAPLPLPGSTSHSCPEREGQRDKKFPSLNKSQQGRFTHWYLTCSSSDAPSQECSLSQPRLYPQHPGGDSSEVPPDTAERNQGSCWCPWCRGEFMSQGCPCEG